MTLTPGVWYGINFRSTEVYVTDPTGTKFFGGGTYPQTLGNFTGTSVAVPACGTVGTINSYGNKSTTYPRIAGQLLITSGTSYFRVDLPNGTYKVRMTAGDTTTTSNGIGLRDGDTGSYFYDTGQISVTANNILALDGSTTTRAAWDASPPEFTIVVTQGFVSVKTSATYGTARINHFGFMLMDSTAPTLSGLSASETSDTTATIGFTSDEAGTAYAVLTTSATPPSATQVKAGQDHTGSAAVWDDSKSVTTSPDSFSATGLTAETAYYAYVVVTDAAGNNSSVGYAGTFTTDAAGGLTVWTDPVVYFKYGKRNRIGTGNALCGYIGAQGDTITVTGTGSGDWKWYATPEAGTVGRTSKAWGLGAAVSGAGTYNGAWVASPSDTYTLTLTHVPTGEAITAIAQLDWSIEFEGVTYTAANAYVVAADYDWFSANGGTGARTYLSRTSTDGGCIMVRDGYNPFENYTSSSASMASTFKSGEDTGFVTPTFSDKLVYDPDFLHGDGISALRVEGLTGGNHTLIIPETDYGATIRTLRPAAGCKVARFIGEKGSYASILYVVADDVTFCYNKFYSANGAGQLIFPASQYYRANIYNNELHDSGDAIVSHFLNWNIAGNWGHSLSSDLVKQSTDFTSIQPPSIDGCISANVCTRFPVDLIGGAHPDVVQAYFQGSYSGNIPGTFRIRQNLSTSWYGQFIFGGGGSAPNTFADITVELNCHFGTAANGIGTASKTDDQVIRNNTLLRDIQNSYVSAVAPVLAAGGSGAVNTTVEDNIVAALTVTTPTGSGSSGTLNNNRNTDLANNQSEYEAMFYAPPAPGSNGVQGYDDDWDSYEAASNGIWQLAAPLKGVLVASGGAMNPDGTYRGSFFPYDPAYPIQPNVPGQVYATHYVLSADPSSIDEGGTFTATVELQDGSGNPAVRGWDTEFTLTKSGTDAGTETIIVPAGQSTGWVSFTQTGGTGTLTLTPTTDADLVDPSALDVPVGVAPPPPDVTFKGPIRGSLFAGMRFSRVF